MFHPVCLCVCAFVCKSNWKPHIGCEQNPHIRDYQTDQTLIIIYMNQFNSLRPRLNRRYFVDDIFKCIFLNEMFEFRLKFHWKLFLRVQFLIIQHCFRWWLGAVQATSHHLNQWWLAYWRIYASLSLNDLSTACISVLQPLHTTGGRMQGLETL